MPSPITLLGRVTLLVVALCLLLLASGPANAASLLAAPFQDHAVLQRDQPISLWGHATAGAQVQLRLAERRVSVRADGNGAWQARLPALVAGGPHVLEVRAGRAVQRIEDLMVGDVWLCSGQSNMDLPVHRSLDAAAEIASADNGRIRLLTLPKVSSATPTRGFDETLVWNAVTPQRVADFSAACYYFARELQKHQDVPMGLINGAWGGSRIQAWMSADALRQAGGNDESLEVLALAPRDRSAAAARWGGLWQRWWRARTGQPATEAPWQPDAAGAWVSATPTERWLAPTLSDVVGMAWYRAAIQLDAAQAKQAAVLELGPVDEMDLAWVNATVVGSGDGAQVGRRYPLPAGTLHAGRNTVVVNVVNTYRQGGINGPAARQAVLLADGTRVPLTDWHYQAVPASVGSPPSAPWMSASGMSTLFNGMIAPLAGYGLRGALWYQGESNTAEASRYARLLTHYRSDLRAHFGDALPLLVVQLANFGPAPRHPGASDWAQLREAQRQAVEADAHSALVVAIDIGERSDIHPANKQELGRRLARAARHVVYGEALPPSGPVPLRAQHDGAAVVLRFGQVEQGLVAYGGRGPVGFELCGATQASCRYANARIDGDRVLLQAEQAATATRVRYGWADSPVVTLYDGNGLPAGPFELSIK
ncbi:MAG: sialate O-acetylesterase [Pseudoxanthomonas sp.]